jgi:prolyl-tRNA synthetase
MKAEMIDYYEISGCYILRPWAYQIWEFITAYFDKKIKEDGVENAYFPLFVSKNALEKEKEHVEGFSPEVAWVTRSGSKDLEVPIAIRPTSETIMYPSYSKWIKSHRDLPLKLNQWTNIVRWEFKNPTPFIRTREFLWQEGHTAHATLEEADKQVFTILDFYKQVYEELLAVPVIQGIKSENEKFAGALRTTTIETMVPTIGKGIQCATSHNLGQNFSKMFDIQFESKDMKNEYVWQTSWGLTTRTIGVAVMVHGDNKGLVLPPRIAPIQIVLIPIITTENEKDGSGAKISSQINDIFKLLKTAGIRCKVDDRDNYQPGWKYNYWEMKGVPVRLELGVKDLIDSKVVLCCRDNKDKTSVNIVGIDATVKNLLDVIQKRMFEKARTELYNCIKIGNSNEELFKLITEKKMIKTMWCNTNQCEDNVKKMVKETLVKIIEANKLEKKKHEQEGNEEDEMEDITEITAKTLCMPLEQDPIPKDQKCFSCNLPAKKWVLWGKTY